MAVFNYYVACIIASSLAKLGKMSDNNFVFMSVQLTTIVSFLIYNNFVKKKIWLFVS